MTLFNGNNARNLEIKGQFTDGHNALLVDPKNAWKNNAVTNQGQTRMVKVMINRR